MNIGIVFLSITLAGAVPQVADPVDCDARGEDTPIALELLRDVESHQANLAVEGERWLGGDTVLYISFAAESAPGCPSAGEDITVVARARTGEFASERVQTNENGIAEARLNFFVPLNDSAIDVEVCPDGAGACLQTTHSVRNRIKGTITNRFNFLRGFSITPENLSIDDRIDATAEFGIEVSLIESRLQPAEVSLFATQPVVYSQRWINNFPARDLSGRSAGLGDFRAGLTASYRFLHAEVSVDTASGGSTFGSTTGSRPDLVRSSDGYTSFDLRTTVSPQVRHNMAISLDLYASSFRPSRLAGAPRQHANDYGANIGVSVLGGNWDIMGRFWGGINFTGREVIGTRIIPAIEGFQGGVTFSDLRRVRMPFNVTVMVGGLGTEVPYIAGGVEVTTPIF